MQIVLPHLLFNPSEQRGMGVFFQNHVEMLAQEDHGNRYVLFGCFWRDFEARKKQAFRVDAPNFSLCLRRFPQRVLDPLEWDWHVPVIQSLLPRGTDLYHALEPWLPHLKPSIRTLVTVHDLFPIIFPGWWPERVARVFQDSCRRAHRIVAVSENTRKDVIQHYGIAPEKIQVIYQGVNHATFRVINEKERFQQAITRYRLTERFILSSGPLERRRQHAELVDVFAGLARRPEAKDVSLVLTGSIGGGFGSYYETLEKKVNEYGIQDRVIFTGFVPAEDLAALYNLAEVFVYPSLYEGFGHTPLEAMACGAPVVTTNCSAIPEVVGDAAVLVNPKKPQEWGAAISALLTDRARREDLRGRGLERSRLFDWRKTALLNKAVYEEMGK